MTIQHISKSIDAYVGRHCKYVFDPDEHGVAFRWGTDGVITIWAHELTYGKMDPYSEMARQYIIGLASFIDEHNL